MNEKPKLHIVEKPEQSLVQRVQFWRDRVLGSGDLLFKWTEDVYTWDKQFKKDLEERYGSKRYAQQVPAWQTLVGGTPEDETDISDEIRMYITEEVDKFITRFQLSLEDKY